MGTISNNESGLSVRTKLNASLAKTDEITDTGSGAIITDAERAKIDNITDIGSGEIISDAERTKLGTIEQDAEVNEETAVFFGKLTSSGTSIALDSKYSSFGSAFGASRLSNGTYRITSSSLFTDGTFVSVTASQECYIAVEYSDPSFITITTYDTSGSLADDLLTSAMIKIENYQL